MKDDDSIRILDFIDSANYSAIYDGTSTFDAGPALEAAIASCSANPSQYYEGTPRISFPSGCLYFANTVELKKTVHLQGQGCGQPGGTATILKFAPNTTAFRINRYDTLGMGLEESPTTGADGSIIEGMMIKGSVDASAVTYGVHQRARAKLRDVIIDGFSTGHYVGATAGSTDPALEGNANGWAIDTVRIQNCRDNGHMTFGGDSNAGVAIGLNVYRCGKWGIKESSFLGNTYISPQVALCGFLNAGGSATTSVVSYGGNRYFVIADQEALASTSQPDISPSVWELMGAGDVNELYPLWVSGIDVDSGGSYRTTDANSRNVFLGAYHEGGQGDAQIVAPSLVLGGNMPLSNESTASYFDMDSTGLLYASRAIGATNTDAAGKALKSFLGGNQAIGQIQGYSHPDYAPNAWRLKFDVANNGDLVFDYGDGASAQPFCITGPNTTKQFGTGYASPYGLVTNELYLGKGDGARKVTYADSAPNTGSHAKGERVYTTNPVAGGSEGWVCTDAGTPGTWKDFGSIST